MEKSNYFSYVRATKKNGAAKQIGKHTVELVKKKEGACGTPIYTNSRYDAVC